MQTKDLGIFAEYIFRNCNVRFLENDKLIFLHTYARCTVSPLFDHCAPVTPLRTLVNVSRNLCFIFILDDQHHIREDGDERQQQQHQHQ